MAMKHLRAVATVAAASALLAGCAGGTTPSAPTTSEPPASSTPATPEVSGDLTVITWRTDLVADGTFDKYKAAFEAKYPGTNVTFESITDYEGEIAVRLQGGEYGDVLAIPNSVSPAQLPQFFEPLGTVEELSKDYLFINEQAYEGTGYGIAVVGNAQGILYNKRVFEEAGATGVPTTPDEFLDALEKVKDNTDAIPYYTNYKDGWPLSQWEGNRGIAGGAAASINLTQTDAPWTQGQYHYIVDSLLHDIVARGLSEEDPLTTNWEESKSLIGTGKVASMLLGSWAIVQMQQAAEQAGADPSDIGYLPFPYQEGGKFHTTVGGDYKQAIAVNSDNKPAARAWIDWFNHESGFSDSQAGISPVQGAPLPEALSAFTDAGVEFVTLDPAPAGQENLEADIRNGAEIDLWGNVYRQKLVDIARGAADGDKESYFAELNQRWAAARAQVAG